MPASGADPRIPVVEMAAPDTTLAAVRIRDSRRRPRPGVSTSPSSWTTAPARSRGRRSSTTSACASRHSDQPSNASAPGHGRARRRCGRRGEGGPAIVRNSTLVAPTNGVDVTDGSEATIRGNVVTSARPGLAGGGGIFVEGGTARIVRNDVSRFNLGVFAFSGRALVSANVIHDGGRGISLGFVMASATVLDNDVRANDEAMFVSSVGAVVSGNRIDGNGGLAFDVQDPASGNEFVANVATNGECSDTTTGAGTAGTANTWIDNIGAPSFPPKICRRPGP